MQPPPKSLRLKRFPAEDNRLQLQVTIRPGLQCVHSLQRIEGRRRLAEHRDLLGNQQRIQIFWRLRHRLRHHNQPATEQQSTPDLPHRIVERQRMTLCPNLTRQTQLRIQSVQQPHHIGMGDRHALRATRRPRRVNQICDVGSCRRRQILSLPVVLTELVEIDDFQIAPCESAQQLCGRDCYCRFRVSEHELDPRVRVHRIDRQVSRARLQHRDDANDRLDRPGEQQCHPTARPHTLADQLVRQTIRSLVQLRIRQRATVECHRCRLWRTRHPHREQIRNRGRWRNRLSQRSPVTPSEQLRVLVGIQELHRRQPPTQVGGHDDASTSAVIAINTFRNRSINRTTLVSS